MTAKHSRLYLEVKAVLGLLSLQSLPRRVPLLQPAHPCTNPHKFIALSKLTYISNNPGFGSVHVHVHVHMEMRVSTDQGQGGMGQDERSSLSICRGGLSTCFS